MSFSAVFKDTTGRKKQLQTTRCIFMPLAGLDIHLLMFLVGVILRSSVAPSGKIILLISAKDILNPVVMLAKISISNPTI